MHNPSQVKNLRKLNSIEQQNQSYASDFADNHNNENSYQVRRQKSNASSNNNYSRGNTFRRADQEKQRYLASIE